MKSLGEIIDIMNALGYLKFIKDETWINYRYKRVFQKDLDLENPKNFNEKMQCLKLYYRNPICSDMIDKVKAKDFVKSRLGEEVTIPTLGTWENFFEIDWDELPSQFVLKCNHDSGG